MGIFSVFQWTLGRYPTSFDVPIMERHETGIPGGHTAGTSKESSKENKAKEKILLSKKCGRIFIYLFFLFLVFLFFFFFFTCGRIWKPFIIYFKPSEETKAFQNTVNQQILACYYIWRYYIILYLFSQIFVTAKIYVDRTLHRRAVGRRQI